jgi:hypothetical protein
MAIRPVARPAVALARRPVVAAAPAPAAKAAAPAPAGKNVKATNADSSFGSDILQTGIYSLMNIGNIIALPAGLSALVGMLPKPMLGGFNVIMGGFNAFKDVMGLRNPKDTKKSDDYIRLGGDAAIIGGGVALLAGAAIAPIVPLIGAGVAAAGYLARAVGIWKDETRW